MPTTRWGWGRTPLPPPRTSRHPFPAARRKALLLALAGTKLPASDDDLEDFASVLFDIGIRNLTKWDVRDFAAELRRFQSETDAGRGPPVQRTQAWTSPTRSGETDGAEGRVLDVQTVPAVAHWTFSRAVVDALARQSRPRRFTALHGTRFVEAGRRSCQAVCRVTTPWGSGCGVVVQPGVLMTSSRLIASPEQAARCQASLFAQLGASCPPCDVRLDAALMFATSSGARFKYEVVTVHADSLRVVVTQATQRLQKGTLVWLDCTEASQYVVTAAESNGLHALRSARRLPHHLREAGVKGDGVVHAAPGEAEVTVVSLVTDSSALTRRQQDALKDLCAEPADISVESPPTPGEHALVSVVSHPPNPRPQNAAADKVVSVGTMRLAGTSAAPELAETHLGSASGSDWVSDGAAVFALENDWKFLGIVSGRLSWDDSDTAVRKGRGARVTSVAAAVTALRKCGAFDEVTGRITQGLGRIDMPSRPASPFCPSPPATSRPASRASCPAPRSGDLAFAVDTPPCLLGLEPFTMVDEDVLCIPPFTVEVLGADGRPDPFASGPGCWVEVAVEAMVSNADASPVANAGQFTVSRPRAGLLRGRARFTSVSLHPCPINRFRLRATAHVGFRHKVRYPLSLRHMQASMPSGHGSVVETADLWVQPPSLADREAATDDCERLLDHGSEVRRRVARAESAATTIQCCFRSRAARAARRQRRAAVDACLGENTASAWCKCKQVRLLHFNDVYHLTIKGNPAAARLATALKAARNRGPPSLTLFSGDALSPSIQATVMKGAHMPPVLNALRVQASVVGNHDLDFGPDRLEELLRVCDFPWILTNVVDTSRGGRPLGGAQRTTILTSENGVRVGLMGIVEEDWILTCGQIDTNSTAYLDMVEATKDAARELREQGAHCVVALTHMRSHNDLLLAAEVGNTHIDVILGGHDHDPECTIVNGVAVIKSGSDFDAYTDVTLTLPAERVDNNGAAASAWVKFGGEAAVCGVAASRVVVADNFEPDEEVERVIQDVEADINAGLCRVVAVVTKSFDCTTAAVRTGESAIGNLVTDVARWGFLHVGADAAILQGGCLRANRVVPEGPMRLGDLLSIVPIEDPMVLIGVTGKQLWGLLEGGLAKYPGHDGRFPQMSGLRVQWDPKAEPGSRVKQVSVLRRGGDGDGRHRQVYEEVDLERVYRVATSDYLSRGKDGYAEFAQGERIVDSEQGMILPTMLRNYLYLQRSLAKAMPLRGKSGRKGTLAGSRILARRSLRKESAKGWSEYLDSPFVGVVSPEIEGRLAHVQDCF
eukprot:TRINITY_DN7486_c0_g1_i1.p1 TRINITY_DN7486_c0_g1~~TRINITY_DN7486_c0_g1_i1.p1  ORF type:complete len:1290 (+),score=373.23 TRINITY_DN7486_c0_g1_i1:60-3929(+)